jgi:peptidoglycan/LPS O-acetylase OafA/YrhL
MPASSFETSSSIPTDTEPPGGSAAVRQNERFLSVHILRGVAAALVVFEHIIGRPPYAAFNRLFSGLDGLGNLGVACFFVISGFVLPWSLGSSYQLAHFPRFMLRRAVRIEPTYIASIFISCLAVMALTRLAPNATPWNPTSALLLQHVFYIVPFTDGEWINHVYWTLAVEFQFYLLLGLFFPFVLRASEQGPMPGLILACSLSLLIFAHPVCPELQLFKYSPFFSLGLLLERCFRQRVSIGQLLFCLLFVSAAAIGGGTPGFTWGAGLVTFAIIQVWHPAQQNLGIFGPVLRFLGTISFSLYVIHQLVASLGENAAHFLAKRPPFQFQVLLVNCVPIFSLAGSIVAATGLYLLVEAPTHRLARRLRLRASS